VKSVARDFEVSFIWYCVYSAAWPAAQLIFQSQGVSAPNLVWRQKGRGYTSDIVAACSLIFGEVGILCPGSRSVCKCDIDLCDGLH
jgi:hypothetical protein